MNNTFKFLKNFNLKFYNQLYFRIHTYKTQKIYVPGKLSQEAPKKCAPAKRRATGKEEAAKSRKQDPTQIRKHKSQDDYFAVSIKSKQSRLEAERERALGQMPPGK